MSRARPEPEGVPEPPAGDGLRLVGAGPAGRSDRREYAFRSMLQLASELSVSLGLYETLDLLMLNLMGQFRTTRSALWLLTEDSGQPVLVRQRGLARASAVTLGTTCAAPLLAHFGTDREPLLARTLAGRVGPSAQAMLSHAGVAVFAPISSGDALLGWLALGDRIDGLDYEAEDLEIISASLGIVGPSILNGRLYSRVLEANRQLQATNARLGEMDQLKSDFLSNVNHELRTPLTIMIGALECVRDQPGQTPVANQFATLALENARHLWSLVENLLTFSDLSRNEAPIQIEVMPAQAELEMLLRRRQPGVAAGLRELSLDCPPELPPMRVDRVRLSQILDELIDNAVKFTPRGCHIRIEADRHAEDGADWVRVRVRDDGPGVPTARLSSVFNAFEQGDGSSTRRVGGLGMGLALCRQLAERMDGRLSAESEPGRGTTITLLLHAAERRATSRG